MNDHERMNYWWRRAKAAEAENQELEQRCAATDLSLVDRVVVITEDGSIFERRGIYNHGVDLDVQDEGRTLKIWPAAER